MKETFVPMLSDEAIAALPERSRDVIEYRKSGLSLNHIQGCPIDCSYCIRHTYGLWDHRQPRALMTDTEAITLLLGHRYFKAHVTPLQIFNRATDPFLPGVKKHLFTVVEDLDAKGLTNHLLVITRYKVETEDCQRLAALRNLKITLLFTYSGISDIQIEPFPSQIAADSLRTASEFSPRQYRTILYFRPLVPGLNDSSEHLQKTAELSRCADAAVFSGLFYREEIAAFYRSNNIKQPYNETARRKILPKSLEESVISAFRDFGGAPLFRKTSCAVSYAHKLSDYNGHYGIRELCDICPQQQVDTCSRTHRQPKVDEIRKASYEMPELMKLRILSITERAATVDGLADEQARYFLQHKFGFQVHDVTHPHKNQRHGRADIGWETTYG